MLGMTSYPREYVDHCRAMVEAQLASYRALAAAARTTNGRTVEEFEPLFFNNLVLVLDNCFVHRIRAQEGKDGNPLNEVRVLANALLLHDGRIYADKQIRLNPATSVLGLKVGDPIRLTEADFSRLATAYFDEIERRFLAPTAVA